MIRNLLLYLYSRQIRLIEQGVVCKKKFISQLSLIYIIIIVFADHWIIFIIEFYKKFKCNFKRRKGEKKKRKRAKHVKKIKMNLKKN